MPMLERRIDHIGTRIRMARGTDVELEFTVDRGVLSILQARTAVTKRQEGICSFDEPGPPAATGIGVCGGAFRGRAAFDESDLEEFSRRRGWRHRWCPAGAGESHSRGDPADPGGGRTAGREGWLDVARRGSRKRHP